MDAPDTEARLAALLNETGQRHHAAFIESDGVDPDWAIWYAGYLQAHLFDVLGHLPSRSELTFLLVSAERAHVASDSSEAWPSTYARYLLANLSS